MSTNIMIVDDEKILQTSFRYISKMTVSMFLNFTMQKTHLNVQCTKILTWQYLMLCCLILTVFHYVNRYEKNISFQSSC